MKKSLILTLAALAMVAQAHGAARDMKTEAKRRLEVKEAARDAAKDVRVSPRAAQLGREIERSAIGSDLSPSAKLRLQEVMTSDAEALSIVEMAHAQQGRDDLKGLLSATVEGVSNLKGIDRSANAQAIAQMDPAARADQAYATLVTSVVKRAVGTNKNNGWSAETRGVAESLLTKANREIASGKAPGEALKIAAREVESEETAKARAKDSNAPEFKLNIDDINKFCKE